MLYLFAAQTVPSHVGRTNHDMLARAIRSAYERLTPLLQIYQIIILDTYLPILCTSGTIGSMAPS